MGRITENPFQRLISPLSGANGSVANNISSAKKELLTTPDEHSDLLNGIGAKSAKLTTGDQPKEIFWRRKGTDGKQIAENLLRENFGFDESDVESYRKTYGELLVFDENQCAVNKKADKPCSSATSQQVQKWQTSSDGQKVYVALPPATVKLFRNFKQERIIDKSLLNVSDLDLRKTVKDNLMEILNGNSQVRITAAEKLVDLETESLTDAEAVKNTIRLSARQPENQNNAVVQLLSAKADLKNAIADKQRAFNFYVNSTGDENNVWYQNARKQVLNYEQQIQKSIDAAAGLDTSNGRRLPNAKVNREEAAWINLQIGKFISNSEKPIRLRKEK